MLYKFKIDFGIKREPQVLPLTEETDSRSSEEQLFTMDDDFDTHYGLLAPEQTVIVRAYSDDSDDQVLQEIKPRYIVMYEPNLEFIRRIEVRRSQRTSRAHP